jgi:hypothetical protein
MAKLSSDMGDASARPYFLWDEKRTVGEFRASLREADPEEWSRLVGKLMREARDTDVWKFVSPREVWKNWSSLKPFLGRRTAFWNYLFTGWHGDGYLG